MTVAAGRCEYAACQTPAVTVDVDAAGEREWRFCAQHLREHRADLHGEQWPRLDEPALRKALRDSRAPVHGTPARYRQHLRDNDRPCDPCVTASRRDANAYGKARRDTGHRRSA